jgi:alpha/beta hydrolase family protein
MTRTPRRRTLHSALALILAALAIAAVPGAGRAATPNPIVEGPIGGGIHNRPWNSSLVDVRPFDYLEEEYFFSGVATRLNPAVPLATAPYKSRMIIKRPARQEDFNGTVLVEWLNVTGATDLETVWPVIYQYIMDEGYAYVGVSAQLVGVCCGPLSLKGWDPTRYATLVHPGDDWSFDIFSQAMKALRFPLDNRTTIANPRVVDPLGGLKLKDLVAGGASQSASRLTSYINNGYDAQASLVDAFNITRGGGDFTSFATPIFQLNEEGQGVRQANSSRYVVWEEAGTAHAPQAWWNYTWEMQMRDAGTPSVPNAVNMGCSVNKGSVDYSARALLAATQEYLDDGTPVPTPPRIERNADGTVKRDANGLALGGIRHPFVQVPVSLNQATGCPLYGLYRPWTAQKIRSLYPTHAQYVQSVEDWAETERDLDWLIEDDADDVVAKAKAFTGPWTDASCYDTYNATGNETGPVSSVLHDLSHDPSMPLGVGPALRDVSCNIVVPLGL